MISCSECGALQGSGGVVRLAEAGASDGSALAWLTQAGDWLKTSDAPMPTRWLALVGASLVVLLLSSLALAMMVGSNDAAAPTPIERDEEPEVAAVSPTFHVGATATPKPLKQAQDCVKVDVCVRTMLDAVSPWRSEVIRAIASSLEQYAPMPSGQVQKARVLNQQALQYWHRGQEVRALELLEQASQAHPGDVDVVSNLGWALLRSGRVAEAETALLRALEMAPRRSAIWIRLAVALNEQNKADDARKALLLAYAFSTQKEDLADYLMARSQSTEFSAGTRYMFANALVEIAARQSALDSFYSEP